LLGHNGSFATVNCRFDIIAITGHELEWLPDAFHADV
jgi:putative endonuclease